MNFGLKQSHTYSAVVRLGFFEAVASNEMISDKLIDAGFVRVTVAGSGRDRMATGTWDRPDESVELPDQITAVTEK